MIKRLNCMNYHVNDDFNDAHWYAQNGLRSLFEYSKICNKSFKTICIELFETQQITIQDLRENDCTTLTLTMI